MADLLELAEVATKLAARADRSGLGSEAYDHFVDNCHYVAIELTELLRQASSAMVSADADIHNWLMGALTQIIPTLGTVITAVTALVRLVSALGGYLEAICVLDLAKDLTTAVIAAGALAEASSTLGAAFVVAAGLAALGWAAVEGITLWVDTIVAGAADRINTVADQLGNSWQWPIPAGGIPSSKDWATP